MDQEPVPDEPDPHQASEGWFRTCQSQGVVLMTSQDSTRYYMLIIIDKQHSAWKWSLGTKQNTHHLPPPASTGKQNAHHSLLVLRNDGNYNSTTTERYRSYIKRAKSCMEIHNVLSTTYPHNSKRTY